MKKRIYQRIMALGLTVSMAVSMSTVSFAATTDSEAAEIQEEVTADSEVEVNFEDADTSEENAENVIDHESEIQSVEADIEEVIDEISNADSNETSEITDEDISIEEDLSENVVTVESVEEKDENVESEEKESEGDDSRNTDPANAEIVYNGSVAYGTIENPNEFLWYAFQLDQTSKYSIWLQMESGLDADLYIFKYDQSTGNIDLIGGSATEGAGFEERSADVLSEGLYFIGVSGYESVGNFAFAYCESTADVAYEMNDTEDAASVISLGSDVAGVLDSPYDVDYYTFTIENPSILKYDTNLPNEYELEWISTTANRNPMSYSNSYGKYIKMAAGTYVFRIKSSTQSFSTDTKYTFRFNKGCEYVDESIAKIRAINSNERYPVVYQTSADGSVGYVNGHKIDISYRYDYVDMTNPYGGQYYHISMEQLPGVVPDTTATVMYYAGSTKPAKRVANKPVLAVIYSGDKSFYKIDCWGSGHYVASTLKMDLNAAYLIIDPEDGKLIDILSPNYYYNYIGNNNYITCVENCGPMMYFD